LFLVPASVYVSAFLTDGDRKWIKILFISALLVQLTVVARIRPVDYFHKQIVDYEAFSQTTSTQNENRSKTFTYDGFADWQPTPKLEPDSGSIEVSYWNGTSRSYRLKLLEESVVIEPTMYFLGWETWVKKTGELANAKKITYILDNTTQGRIAYKLPDGEYVVKSTFTQNTLARILGNSLFGLGLVIFLVIFIKGRSIKYDK
jgi:hypothetical protein